MIHAPLRASVRATTPARLPPPAFAATAGLHLLVGAAVLVAWQAAPPDEMPLPVEIAVVMPAPPQPEAPGKQANEQPPESRPETQPETAVAAAAEPMPEAAPESPPPPITFDPSMIPAPEPPPPVVLRPPVAKPKPVPPAAPRPAPPPVARPAPPSSPPSSPPGDAAATTPAPPAAPPSLAVPRPDPSYLDRLAAAIERERDYPTLARRQGHQGRVVVHLVVAASGRLLTARVATGSGLDTLDQAALGMVRRARLPPLGPGFGAESASFTIPIVFAIR